MLRARNWPEPRDVCHSEGWQPDAGAPASRFTFAPVSPFSPFTLLVCTVCVSVSTEVNKQIDLWLCRSIDDLRKSRGLHSVSAYRHSLYIQVHACGCGAE